MTPPAATAAGTRALPRTAIPRAPRRVSGPQTRTRRGEDARRAPARGATASDPFIFRVLRGAQQLADSRLLDRLIRGRLWIPLVAAALMGIVFMQVSMLKLNAGIGRAVQSSATLERQNSTLRAEVSRLESGSRIDGAAHDLGMVVPADGSTHYVTSAGREQAGAAAERMTAADPDAIARAQAGSAQAQGQAAGTLTTGSATAAALPAQAAVQAAQGQSAAPTGTTATATATATPAAAAAPATTAAPTTTTATGTGAATATPTPSAATTTGGQTAAGAAAAAPQQQATSGGAAAPAQE
jgi:cell division protein FtsL